ncbi:MAG TPA: hypothetical protein VGD78_09340, partial [Chthoniobacterales bacterium]
RKTVLEIASGCDVRSYGHSGSHPRRFSVPCALDAVRDLLIRLFVLSEGACDRPAVRPGNDDSVRPLP